MLNNGCQAGSPSVLALPSLSPSWMAVTGRQKLQAILLSHAVMAASASARLTSANRLGDVNDGDGHFFRRANELDFLARVEELFARCLGGRGQPLDGDRQPGSTGRVRDATN